MIGIRRDSKIACLNGSHTVHVHDPCHSVLTADNRVIAQLVGNAGTAIAATAFLSHRLAVNEKFPVRFVMGASLRANPVVESARRHLQDTTHGTHSKLPSMILNETVSH